MRKIEEVLRLHHAGRRSNREIAQAVRVSPTTVADYLRRARQAGLQGDFAGHSLRSGFVTEGGRQGIALPALMAMSEHRSVSSVIGYFQAGGVADNPAANLLGSKS